MRKLSLCDAEGERLLEMEKVALPDIGEGRAWWAARTIAVKPGTYRLRLDLPGGETLEQVLVASRGWMTLVFLKRRYYPESGNQLPEAPAVGEAGNARPLRGIRNPERFFADLENASVLVNLNQQNAFRPSDQDARLTDLACQGLARGQQVLSNSILRETLAGKFRNPMLGILGGHLLLLERRSEPDPRDERSAARILLEYMDGRMRQLFGPDVTFKTLVTNLRHIFNNEPHPDVEALGLLVDQPGPNGFIFKAPPMLHQSWRLIVDATAGSPGIVPGDSISARIALRVQNVKPWLLIRTLSESDHQEHVAQFQQALESKVGRAKDAAVGREPPFGLQFDIAPNPARDLLMDGPGRRKLVRDLGLPVSAIENLARKASNP